MSQATATAKQVSYITALEAKTGHAWTEYVRCPEGATIDAMPMRIASQVIDALKALPALPGYVAPQRPAPRRSRMENGWTRGYRGNGCRHCTPARMCDRCFADEI